MKVAHNAGRIVLEASEGDLERIATRAKVLTVDCHTQLTRTIPFSGLISQNEKVLCI